VEAIRQELLGVIAADPRFAATSPLTHDDYKSLADRLATVAGVSAATYVGDGLGGIRIGIDGGGVFEWQHIVDPVNHEPAMPEGFDFGTLNEPTHNAGFAPPEIVSGPRAASGTYATHFPVATNNPDPLYKADDGVTCERRGSIAIVDFYYSEVKAKGLLYNNEFDVDGVELWDRIKRMGEEAGFAVKIFHDDEINASNFASILNGYTYVVMNGHGGSPGPKNTDRLHEPLVTINTPEKYDAAKKVDGGSKTYEEAWNLGWMNRGLSDNTVRWTPRLIKALYEPTVPQMWLLSTCYAMMPFGLGFAWSDGGWSFRTESVGQFYNFGHALRDKQVKTVFGYLYKANVWAVTRNLMPFFRRQFGGYFANDRPPSPQTFWPTCMSVQTYFRRLKSPAQAVYANKLDGTSLYTMYTQADPVYLRSTCQEKPPNVHAMMQDFVLSAGTPATAFQHCWDLYWGQGKAATPVQDALCSKGDFPTTATAVQSAGCNVKIARRVTNAMLP